MVGRGRGHDRWRRERRGRAGSGYRRRTTAAAIGRHSKLRHLDSVRFRDRDRGDWACGRHPVNLLIFTATLGSAFYNSYGKKALEFHSPMRMLFWTYVAVCLMMAPVVFTEEYAVFARIPHFTAQTWIGMALLTFFHNFLSMVLFLKALKNLDAIQASLSNYLITFFGIPIAAIWLHEKLGLAAIAGGVLRSEEHTSELQSLRHLVCRLLLEK